MTRGISSRKTDLNIRAKFVISAVFIFAPILVYRLADLQLLSYSEIRAQAAKQQSTVRILHAERGKIFYKEKTGDEEFPIATNRSFSHVFVVPQDIQGIENAINKLLPLVEEYGLDEEILRFRLSKENDIYEPIAHKLTDEQLQPFIDLNLEGLEWEDEKARFYPDKDFLSHITGFVGISGEDRVGQYGLEGFFEEELKGKDGLLEGKTDILGRLIQTGPLKRNEPEPGTDFILTINRTLQAYVCNKLEEQIENVAAESGSVVIVNPDTGAILAMCSYPSFDPNKYNEVEDIKIYMNSVVASTYEPGSIFKPFTMAAAIDDEAVTAQTTYIDEGVEEIGKYKIRNSDGKAHGEVDMVFVLNESLNTGAIFVQRQIGNEKFKDYVEKFGFGRSTDIELGNELSGNISSLYKPGDIYAATGSFGQGITTTPIQIVMAYAALANGGKLMKPYIIQEKRQQDKIIYTEPSLVDEPISVQASTIISGMLVSVVRVGHAKSAGVEGYYIAGKTGTAQVAESGEYGNKTIHSFCGYGPVDNPIFAMLVKLDYPQYGIYAASTAAPLFGDIAKFILQYYEVPPDEAQ
ncbi:penicillin-binding protein 2 [Patescibacteria group bacterium]|nr:penicillin-binding protein 2 [Patescibacteria group bacterium]